MDLNNRITLYVAILIGFAMILLPCAIAQPGGRSGGMMGGGMMGGGDNGPGPGRGDRDGGRGGMSGGRGGMPGGRGGMFTHEEVLTESQIDRVLHEFSRRNPTRANELKELRKTDKEKFDTELRRSALLEILGVTSTDREYNGYLEWSEKYVADEAAGIKELKEENYDLYKERLDKLRDKYRSLINSMMPEELMRISVRDLQLTQKLTDLSVQHRRRGLTQEQKDKILSEIREVVSEQYDQRIKRDKYNLKIIEERIKSFQEEFDEQMKITKGLEDPEVKDDEVDRIVEMITQSRRGFGSGMFGRSRGIPPSIMFQTEEPNMSWGRP